MGFLRPPQLLKNNRFFKGVKEMKDKRKIKVRLFYNFKTKKGFVKVFIFFLSLILFSFNALAEASKNHNQQLVQLIHLALKENPELLSYEKSTQAEFSLIASKSFLKEPMIGFSTLDRNHRTTYAVLSQKIKFPTKYVLKGSAQKKKAQAMRSQTLEKKWEIRGDVIRLYYSLYSLQKIIEITKANKSLLQGFARVAEKHYASGKSPRWNSMKAHFEQTRLELELVRLKQQEKALQEELKVSLGQNDFQGLHFSKKSLSVPVFQVEKMEQNPQNLNLQLQSHSPYLKREFYFLEEARVKRSLARWSLAPDFEFRFQQRISGEPEDSRIYSFMMSFPIWFWAKGSEVSHAAASQMAHEYRFRSTQNKILSQVEDLKNRVLSQAYALKIYKTSLIPQAEGAFQSSTAGYRASQISFLELLDSERTLYQVKADFYRALEQYIATLVQLEATLGFSVSNLYSLENDNKGDPL